MWDYIQGDILYVYHLSLLVGPDHAQDIIGPKSKQYQEQDACAPSGTPQLGLKNEFRDFIITEM